MGISGIQYAKASGLTVITTASPKNFDYVKSLGADHVFDYRDPAALVASAKAAAGGKQVRHAWDCQANEVSAKICAEVISAAEGGKYAALLYGTEETVKGVNAKVEPAVSLYYTAFGERFCYKGPRDPVPENLAFAARFWELSRDLLAEGKVKPIRVIKNQGGSGLEGVLKGLEDMRDGNYSAGKLVYTLC